MSLHDVDDSRGGVYCQLAAQRSRADIAEAALAKCHEFAVGVSIGGEGAEFWRVVRNDLCDELTGLLHDHEVR